VSSHRVSVGAVSLALLSGLAVGCGSSGVPTAAHAKLPATVAAKTKTKTAKPLVRTKPAAKAGKARAAGHAATVKPVGKHHAKGTSHTGTTPVPMASTSIVQAVLRQINAARSAAGLPAYTITSGLTTSAGRHTAVMAGGCGLSHQCPGEAGLGPRISAAGVTWNALGENIGEGGPVSATTAAEISMAEGLTRSMLAEKPPNDGHRKNLLSSSFHHVGISVYRSSSGTVWMTQDFSN
jgi:uncharacterized protein YkwD